MTGWFFQAAIAALSMLAIGGCKQRDPRLEALNINEAEARAILAELSAKPSVTKEPPSRVRSKPSEAVGVSTVPVPRHPEPTDWRLDAPLVIARATRSAAHPSGVLLIDADDKLHLASLLSTRTNGAAGETRIEPAPSSFGKAKLGRGPAYDATHVYWIRRNLLLRRPLKPPHEPLEVLANDARVGTRVSVLSSGKLDNVSHSSWVQYIALPREQDGPLRAKLWFGADASIQLSQEANSILSAALIRTKGNAYFLGIEARTGMSALHARQLHARPKPVSGSEVAPALSDDEILWFGPQAQPWTELKLQTDSQASIVALLAQGRDTKSFGLAGLKLIPARGANTERHWQAVEAKWEMYANGLDPAPLATGHVCGKNRVLLVRPEGRHPGSSQELMMAELSGGSLQQLSHITTAKVIFDVSVASLPGGALVSYVADRKVWAQTIRCR